MLFQGEQYDADLGLYYMRARWYDPAIGRFWSMDKFSGVLADPDTLHKYQYANFNPAAYHDPSGYFSFTISGIMIESELWYQVQQRIRDF